MATSRDRNLINEFLALSSANNTGINNSLPQIFYLIQDHKVDVLVMQEAHRIYQTALQA